MRLKDLTQAEMTPAQKAAVDAATAGTRGHVPAPLRAWLHSPEFGNRAQSLGEFVRYHSSLGPALSELAILVTARFWNAHFEWFAHKPPALAAGLDPAVIDAIAHRRTPIFADPRARVVHDYATALHTHRSIPPALHAEAVAALGEQGVVDLVGVLGYYTLVSMTLNAFDIGVPPGERDEFADLG